MAILSLAPPIWAKEFVSISLLSPIQSASSHSQSCMSISCFTLFLRMMMIIACFRWSVNYIIFSVEIETYYPVDDPTSCHWRTNSSDGGWASAYEEGYVNIPSCYGTDTIYIVIESYDAAVNVCITCTVKLMMVVMTVHSFISSTLSELIISLTLQSLWFLLQVHWRMIHRMCFCCRIHDAVWWLRLSMASTQSSAW